MNVASMWMTSKHMHSEYSHNCIACIGDSHLTTVTPLACFQDNSCCKRKDEGVLSMSLGLSMLKMDNLHTGIEMVRLKKLEKSSTLALMVGHGAVTQAGQRCNTDIWSWTPQLHFTVYFWSIICSCFLASWCIESIWNKQVKWGKAMQAT